MQQKLTMSKTLLSTALTVSRSFPHVEVPDAALCNKTFDSHWTRLYRGKVLVINVADYIIILYDQLVNKIIILFALVLEHVDEISFAERISNKPAFISTSFGDRESMHMFVKAFLIGPFPSKCSLFGITISGKTFSRYLRPIVK